MRGLAVIGLLLLTACKAEPSFDERYQAETNRIDGLASNMQAELNAQIDAASAAGRLGVPVNEQDGSP